MTWTYEKHNYLNEDISVNISSIFEYDIAIAGPSILLSLGYINESIYNKIITHDDRKVFFGRILQKKPDLNKILNDGFIYYMNKFMEINDIEKINVLSIKKDSIFLMNKQCKNLKIDKLEFKLKNKYSSYYHINNLEFYYNSLKNTLDIKGISDDKLPFHKPFIDELKKIFKLAELNKVSAINYLNKLRTRYLERNLDISYYRELNSESSIKVGKYYLEQYDRVDEVDLSYNYINYIMSLFSIYL